MESNWPTFNEGNETPTNPKTGGLPKPGGPGKSGNETPTNPKTGGLPRPGGPGADPGTEGASA